jgi:hypothetical protein
MYPQLETGVLSQYPVQKRRRTRTVVNRAADGSTVKLADPAGESTEWSLSYSGLSNDEAAALRAFFDAVEGSLIGFTFVDPAGNLLAWSEELTEAAWQKDPLLSATPGISDPAGGTNAWRLTNMGAGTQSMAQTIEAPGRYQYCWSAFVKAAAPTVVGLHIGGRSSPRPVTAEWQRVQWAATGDAQAASVRFAIEIAAGSTVDVFGLQVEAQASASAYRATRLGGVYADAHLADDTLSLVRTDANRNSCTVKIIHANHL